MKKIFLSSFAPKSITDSLTEHGYDPIPLPPSPKMVGEVAAHADMLMFKANDKIIISKYYVELVGNIHDINLTVSDEAHGEKYPKDIIYNCFIYQGKCFGKKSNMSLHIVKFCEENEIETVDLKQGYAKCSSIVTPNCLITGDKGVFDTVAKCCTECYLIDAGKILLPGCDTGFIGGATFFDDGKLYFFGDYKTIPDFKIVEQILEKHNIIPISLAEGELYDLGGAIVV